MQILDEAALSRMVAIDLLIPRLEEALRGGADAPPRVHIDVLGGEPSTLLLMPAWRSARRLGVKIVTVDPTRSHRGQHTVNGLYVLLDASTGEPNAVLGARTLTATRTASVAALASSYLARADAGTLLMAGTGTLAPFLIRGHAAVRPIRHVLLWGRDRGNAAALAARLSNELPELRFTIADDLVAAVQSADIISCATPSLSPYLPGETVRPGTHVDLVGSFKPTMREVSPDLVARASVFVDTMEALSQSGDLIPAIEAGVLQPSSVCALSQLVRDPGLRRRDPAAITIFKAVGMAVADLAAAEFFLERASADQVSG
jgi:ornithine cyclodeaminase